MTILQALLVASSLAVVINACIIDVWKPWAYHNSDLTYDSVSTNVPLNDNYNCFDFCPETGITMAQIYIKPSRNTTHTLPKRFSLDELKASKLDSDFDSNTYTCIDGSLRVAIVQSLSKLTKYTAKAIATNLQYNLNKPGWVMNVIKHQQWGSGPGDYLEDTNFCLYETVVQGDFVTIQMGLVDTNPQL